MLALHRALGGIAFAFVVASGHDAHAGPPLATVHITSEVPVALERRGGPVERWQPLCDAPCDRDLPLDGEYRVVFASRIAPTAPFPLEANAGGAVELTIEPPSKGKRIAGIALIGVGTPLAVGGAAGAIALLAAAAGSTNGNGGIATGLAAISGLIGLIGTGVILGGFGLVSGAEAQTTQAPREPTWSPPRAEAQTKPAVFVPLTVSF